MQKNVGIPESSAILIDKHGEEVLGYIKTFN